MRVAVRCLVVALALIVLAPAVGAHERGGGPRVATQAVRVRVIDFAFRPRNLTIDRGTVVRWVNRGVWNHTLAPGETFRRRFRRMGTFAYHCSIHPQMTARVIVT
jgi:plastocyanin